MARGVADTRDLTVAQGSPVELFLVVEGDRGGLPVYCTDFPRIRIDGRAIPDRLVTSPMEQGLANREIHWIELAAADGARWWGRQELEMGANRWSIPVLEFPEDDRDPYYRSFGTGRFAAAIDVGDGEVRVLETNGFLLRPAPLDVSSAGLSVCRHGDPSLPGRALGLMRIPVFDEVPEPLVRSRVALDHRDWVVTAYEELTSFAMPSRNVAPLTDESWRWLFVPVVEDVLRRPDGGLPFVAPRGRAVGWSSPLAARDGQISRGDVLLGERTIALLDGDDGDGWLDNEDTLFHVEENRILAGKVYDFPGETLTVVRPRNFGALRSDLTRAGYGELGLSWLFDATLARAVREFQGDRGLEATGVPDDVFLGALDAFLGRLDSLDGS